MQKGNWYKKTYIADKFGWRFYCKHARLGQKRADKKATAKSTRRLMQKELGNILDENSYFFK